MRNPKIRGKKTCRGSQAELGVKIQASGQPCPVGVPMTHNPEVMFEETQISEKVQSLP